MKDIRRAVCVIGLSALLAVAPAATGATAQADSGPASASASDGGHRAPAAKSVLRRYGGWAVEQDAWNQTVRIAFRGHADEVVGARTGVDAPECQFIRLATRAGDGVRQGRSDFWTLPVSVQVTNHPEQGLLGGEIDRIITPTSTTPVRTVGQAVDGDQCSEKSPLTIEARERVTGSTYYAGADGLYAEPGRTLFCDRDARYHVAERGDTFWFFNEERPLEVEAVRPR